MSFGAESGHATTRRTLGRVGAVIVACHAVFSGASSDDVSEDASWFLKPFQKGEARLFIEHLKYGIQIADSDPRSLRSFPPLPYVAPLPGGQGCRRYFPGGWAAQGGAVRPLIARTLGAAQLG